MKEKVESELPLKILDKILTQFHKLFMDFIQKRERAKNLPPLQKTISLGLISYQNKPEHIKRFFGRENYLTRFQILLDQLEEALPLASTSIHSSIINISGESGVGKSSIINVYLIPELEKRGYTLSKAITDYRNFSSSISPKSLLAIRPEITAFVYDQFERFAIDLNKEEQQLFINEVKELQQQNPSLLFFFSFRSDYKVRLDEVFYDWVPDLNIYVTPFTENETRQVLKNLFSIDSEPEHHIQYDELIKAICLDLHQTKIKINPVELQLVLKGIDDQRIVNKYQYYLYKGKKGFIASFLELVASHTPDSQFTTEVLLPAFVDSTDGICKARSAIDKEVLFSELMTADPDISQTIIEQTLSKLCDPSIRILTQIYDPSFQSKIAYKLTHDFISTLLKPEIEKVSYAEIKKAYLEESVKHFIYFIMEDYDKKNLIQRSISFEHVPLAWEILYKYEAPLPQNVRKILRRIILTPFQTFVFIPYGLILLTQLFFVLTAKNPSVNLIESLLFLPLYSLFIYFLGMFWIGMCIVLILLIFLLFYIPIITVKKIISFSQFLRSAVLTPRQSVAKLILVMNKELNRFKNVLLD